MNVSKDFEDFDPDDPDDNFRKQRWDYWSALKLVRKEYLETSAKLNGQFDAYDFEDYVEVNYGLRMNIVNGNITDGYKITNEVKYTYFLLKFK